MNQQKKHERQSGNTALHFACQFNHLICSMQLINFGSRLDLINSVSSYDNISRLLKKSILKVCTFNDRVEIIVKNKIYILCIVDLILVSKNAGT